MAEMFSKDGGILFKDGGWNKRWRNEDAYNEDGGTKMAERRWRNEEWRNEDGGMKMAE